MFAKGLLGLATVLSFATVSNAQGISTGAAPPGDAKAVAARIIKYNFDACKIITSAKRNADGTIIATCDGVRYRVFTIFNPKEGKMTEVALNCAAAERVGVSGC